MASEHPYDCVRLESGFCKSCGLPMREGCNRNCPAKAQPSKTRPVGLSMQCESFGAKVDAISTVCCGGKKTRHFVYACAIHVRTQLYPILPDIHACSVCKDFVEKVSY